jgi:hypothetical protein
VRQHASSKPKEQPDGGSDPAPVGNLVEPVGDVVDPVLQPVQPVVEQVESTLDPVLQAVPQLPAVELPELDTELELP